QLRWRVLNALRSIQDGRAIKPLLDFIPANPPSESVHAAWAVLTIDPSAEMPWKVLTENARSDYPAIRAFVLDAFENLNSAKALPILRSAADDPHPRIRHRIQDLISLLAEQRPK